MENFHLSWKSFQKIVASRQVSNKIPDKNLFILEHFQIIWKSFISSGKVSELNQFLDMFPDKFLEKICFRTKPGIFPDSMETISRKVYVQKYFPKKNSDKNFWKNMFLDKICISFR